MDEIVLRFKYLGKEVDLMIDDVDKVMWIDLINEYEYEFIKKKYEMFEFPVFHYCYVPQSIEIYTNKDMMTMLERLSKNKIIYIHGF